MKVGWLDRGIWGSSFDLLGDLSALSSYEDALAEAVYEELDYLLTQKEGLGSPDQRTDVPAENYDDAKEVPVPGTPPASQGSEEEVPPEKDNGVRSSQTGSSLNFSREAADPGEGEESLWLLQGKKGDAGLDIQDINPIRAAGLEEDIVSYYSEFPKKPDPNVPQGNDSAATASEERALNCSDSRQLRLVERAGPCTGRVEILDQGSWGTICDDGWDLDDARVVCRQLGCGEALSAVESAPFGAGSGPIWLDHVYCGRMESHVWQCPSWGWGRHNCGHDEDARVICSGFVHLVGKDGPCSGRVEVYSGEAWIPVSDGTFTLPTAQVICAELRGSKVVSVLGHVPFRESDGRVWAEEFRCEGEEPKLWSCPRLPCPGGSCHHSGAVQLVCSAYSEVWLMTNDSSQCEGQVEMDISGRWRVLCASHWSLANANVVCRQLGCGVAISTPGGPHLVEEDSRQLRLVDGGGPCAGRVEILDQGSWGTICDDGWDLDDARVVCRQLGCGEALNATGSAHFGAGSGPIWLDDLNCTGKESQVWRCPSRGWGRHDCRHKEDAGVICSEFLARRMVSEDQQSAGWLEVFYSGVWGSVCRDPIDDITVSVICRQLGCGDSGTLDTFVALREGSRPRKKTQELSSCCPLHRCKDNIAPDYSRCCDPFTVRGEYSDSGTRPASNPLLGIFSLPGILCLILVSLLFLVLVILVTQLLRWRAQHRALSSYEDALAEAMYEELDYLVTQKEGLLGSPEAPDQRTDAPGEDYDDGSSLNISREEADPGEGEESPCLLQGEKGDPGYDDVELSVPGTSTVTFL
ncbi:hypothetical protein MJG53_004077 [Ovis ammon polii x Ovis aries]|uniref:Uncharacterized protein n=1 Tax=Ovis ammon polii x Ovis aries TaxID=2918886 RepID=A0ACB9VA05_9CETA|nr:hypothetical protein MJG53_004077 [Ovis ammon polii x Ovis aries]